MWRGLLSQYKVCCLYFKWTLIPFRLTSNQQSIFLYLHPDKNCHGSGDVVRLFFFSHRFVCLFIFLLILSSRQWHFLWSSLQPKNTNYRKMWKVDSFQTNIVNSNFKYFIKKSTIYISWSDIKKTKWDMWPVSSVG